MTRTCKYKAEEIQIHLIFVVNTELSKKNYRGRNLLLLITQRRRGFQDVSKLQQKMTCTLRVEKEQREFVVWPTKGIQSKLCF